MRERDESEKVSEVEQAEKTEQEEADEEAQRDERLAQREAQWRYIRGTMASPETRAAIAFRRAGLPLSAAVRDKIIGFELTHESVFELHLSEAVQIRFGGAVLEFDTEVQGRLGKGLSFDFGVRCSAELEKELRTGRVKSLQRGTGDELLADTDDDRLAQVSGTID